MGCLASIKTYNGPAVTLPNNTRIAPAKQGLLPLSRTFSDTARTATNLPALKSSSLVAVGPLCDDGKAVIFNKKCVYAIDNTPQLKKVIDTTPHHLHGTRNTNDGC